MNTVIAFAITIRKPGQISGILRTFRVERTERGVYEITVRGKWVWKGRARSHKIALDIYLEDLKQKGEKK